MLCAFQALQCPSACTAHCSLLPGRFGHTLVLADCNAPAGLLLTDESYYLLAA